MSFLVRSRPERRHADMSAFQAATIIPPNSQAASPGAYGAYRPMEWSLQKTAVWACVTLTATMAECMPIRVFSSDEDDKRPLPMPRWLADLGGDGHGLEDWVYQAITSWMLRGNDYGVVPEGMRDSATYAPRMIQLQHPDAVAVTQPSTGDPPQWRIAGKEIPADRIWHRRVHPVPGRLIGVSPVEYGTGVISLGVAVTRFGLSWFHDGAHPSSVLTTDRSINEKQATTAKQRFMAALAGRREPVVLGGGWKLQAIQVSPNESQFLETHQFTAAECCRLFGPGYAQVFGYASADSLTYANIEQRSLDLLTYSVDPWLERLERSLTLLLPGTQRVKFDRKGLLRSDLLTRYRAHEIALRNRLATVNESRAEEDLPPVEWGDEPPSVANPAAPPIPVSVEDK